MISLLMLKGLLLGAVFLLAIVFDTTAPILSKLRELPRLSGR